MISEMADPGRPLRADAARNRARILEAARQVFADRGLDATLDDVARAAGVGVGTVYRRFPNKESLVDALFEDAVSDMVDLALEAACMPDSWEGLVWFLERASQRQAADRGLKDVIMHGMCSSSQVVEARGRIVPAVTALVEGAQRDGCLRDDVVAADIPIIELMVNSVASYSSGLAPDLWRRYLAIVLDGLATGSRPKTALAPAPSNEIVEVALRSQQLAKAADAGTIG
jgi:AcrR family transcriptional regulator